MSVEDSKWERYGPLGGVVFVGLDVIVAILGGEPPPTSCMWRDLTVGAVAGGR